MNADLRRYLKVGAILCLIGGISALFITGANLLTAEKIKENELQKQEEALAEVYPSAVSYSDETTLSDYTYLTNSWFAYGDEAKSQTIGTIYKASGKNNYGASSRRTRSSSRSLGTCPALAITKSFEAAIGMGILFTFVLVCSNVLISALRKLIPEEVETPAYIVIVATFVTVVKMLCEAFVPALYTSLGVFLSLLVVNCIVLGRAEAFANKNGVVDSFLDGFGNGIGYTLALVVISLVREILGTGMLTFGNIFPFLKINGEVVSLYILRVRAGIIRSPYSPNRPAASSSSA
jgi:RnfABCDGE-type electron transport complex E subunit